jgi:nucleoside 2-deoxyribosyltransferase
MRTKYDLYIASGWFNKNQEDDLNNIKKLLDTLNIKYFSPKDHLICPPMASPEFRHTVFSGNEKAIKLSKFVLVNTRDKDMGTIFEAGIAYQMGKPIIYYCEGLKGPFNLMLSQSGRCVATSLEELKQHLIEIIKNENYYKDYVGAIE